MKTKRVVFLKNTGKIDADDIDPEGLTHCNSHQHNVSNIATVEESGDVGRKTTAHSLTDVSWSKVKDKDKGHIQYILALKGIGISLNLFSNTRQLVTAMRDCIKGTTLLTARRFGLKIFTALGEAFSKASIVHCEISFGNTIIFLDENGNFECGLLIGWDLSKCINKMNTRQRDRMVDNSIKRSFGSSYLWTGKVAIHVCGPASRRQQTAYHCG